MKKCTLTQGPFAEKQSWKWFQNNKNRRSLQHTMNWQNFFRQLVPVMKHLWNYQRKYQERFWLITDALMMNDLEDLKRVHNLANYLMVKANKG